MGTAGLHLDGGQVSKLVQYLQVHLSQAAGQTQGGQVLRGVKRFGVNGQSGSTLTLELYHLQKSTSVKCIAHNKGNLVAND